MEKNYSRFGFLFDLDGVIVDTAVLHYQAWRKLANSLGFDFSPEQNEQLKGVGRIESLKIILGWGNIHLAPEEIEAMAQIKNDWYVQSIKHLSPASAMPGAINFLKKCAELGIRIGLGSASKNAVQVLESLEISNLFDVIIDGNAVQKSKPDPEVFLEGAIGLGLPPNHCVVFEDAAVGIIAGKDAGMITIGIGDKKDLPDADIIYPDLSYADLDEVLHLLAIDHSSI